MSYAEAMAKHYHDKQKDGNTKYQLKYTNTCVLPSGVIIHSNDKLNNTIIDRVKEIGDKFNFVDSPIYSDEYMKKWNKAFASAETVDELATYLGDLDEGIEVIKADNHVEKGLVLEQWSTTNGIHLKTYFYI